MQFTFTAKAAALVTVKILVSKSASQRQASSMKQNACWSRYSRHRFFQPGASAENKNNTGENVGFGSVNGVLRQKDSSKCTEANAPELMH